MSDVEERGRCPKCGVPGRNHQAPEPDPDAEVLKVPFECLSCGHQWSESIPQAEWVDEG